MPEGAWLADLETGYILALAGGLLAGGLLGWLTAQLRAQRRIAELSTTLRLEREAAERRWVELEKGFSALSAEALRQNNQAFLTLAQETLKQFHGQAEHALASREQAVAALVQPIREALQKTEEQIRRMEQERQTAYGALHKHLETMAATQQQLQSETRNLVQALRRPEVRGQWGEITLRRLAELAGMVEHCDFYEQEQRAGEDGTLRPDMVIRMPAGREVVVDVKTPLDAYLSAVEAGDDEERRTHLARHARNVRERVRELASKRYWSQFERAPDFVVLFIPGEQFLNAALDLDRGLLESALAQRVILATPTSFVALLRAVAFGWRQEVLAENAEQIRSVGEALYQRLATFADHLGRLGRSLDGAVQHFNKAVGSFDASVMPGARRFTEMGLRARKPLAAPEPVDKAAREVSSREGE